MESRVVTHLTGVPNHAAKPGYDRETMLTVIRAYQAGRRAGIPHLEIELQTIAAFLALHPDVPRSEAGQIRAAYHRLVGAGAWRVVLERV